jgi:hypothetical protein
MELDHFVCNNKECCNPAHVRPVLPRENKLRSESRAATNLAKTHCPQGHPLVPGNLDATQLKRGDRWCRTCKNADMARSYVRRKTA